MPNTPLCSSLWKKKLTTTIPRCKSADNTDNDNKLHTSVYRKPTHTDQYLHHSSNHPPQFKRGIIANLARRAVNICSTSQQLQTERNHLRHVFTNFNNYPTSLVEQTINSILSPRERPPRQQTAPFAISLPYIGTVSHQIQRLLKHHANIDTVFQRGRTIQNILSANGRPSSSKKEDPAGVVYHIQCDCGDSYVGETSRPLPIRMKEHRTDHTQTHPDHNIQWNNITILVNNQSDNSGNSLVSNSLGSNHPNELPWLFTLSH
ncbi:uncharacterized protein [Haliotis cracherodii]|uniref:uncharacterized protein n=1 Tax=Haliotis cracherodii TaxID=6455 RepID=UPI0039E8E093